MNNTFLAEITNASDNKKKPSKMDAFNQLQTHQGLSDAITAITNGYLFRQKWQMEHEILNGERLLDYIVERITLQDSLLRVMRFLCLYSQVNGGLKEKEYDVVRKEIIQVGKKVVVVEELEIIRYNLTKVVGRIHL